MCLCWQSCGRQTAWSDSAGVCLHTSQAGLGLVKWLYSPGLMEFVFECIVSRMKGQTQNVFILTNHIGYVIKI